MNNEFNEFNEFDIDFEEQISPIVDTDTNGGNISHPKEVIGVDNVSEVLSAFKLNVLGELGEVVSGKRTEEFYASALDSNKTIKNQIKSNPKTTWVDTSGNFPTSHNIAVIIPVITKLLKLKEVTDLPTSVDINKLNDDGFVLYKTFETMNLVDLPAYLSKLERMLEAYTGHYANINNKDSANYIKIIDTEIHTIKHLVGLSSTDTLTIQLYTLDRYLASRGLLEKDALGLINYVDILKKDESTNGLRFDLIRFSIKFDDGSINQVKSEMLRHEVQLKHLEMIFELNKLNVPNFIIDIVKTSPIRFSNMSGIASLWKNEDSVRIPILKFMASMVEEYLKQVTHTTDLDDVFAGF